VSSLSSALQVLPKGHAKFEVILTITLYKGLPGGRPVM
jgi:hypothetical protein